ncbi:L-threonylcarbamoyladenylate synthase [Sandaracinobacteroides saxicola]|uniref:Threonylcarbamoyl-AMP synthase n=1 Tax=Sandaracinobacteroides saxicola TaxID=2759707 RepID=A0A7G5IFI9_9SPHN|nr:L-threonylcarbamoyladenylate synthase [Sandaracinobacteroides saxicola]QMW22131.1 threonylcarbamoyl-AMP synthase [Sandaracinobacteroides saxicola]
MQPEQTAPFDTVTRPADADGIAAAVALLAAGGTVALPTETVYGLAADAANGAAVARVYAAKGRPAFNPLIVHVADLAMAECYASFDSRARALATAFWPGGLTLVLPLRERAPAASLVTAGLPSIALRIPAHPVMQAVVRGLGRGVAAPSANTSGRLSPTRAAHVATSLAGRIPLILDAGPCALGLESSIVSLTGETPRLLRPGAIPLEALRAHLPNLAAPATNDAVIAPGMTDSHYAPAKPLRLNAAAADASEWHLGFGAIAGDDNLSPTADLTGAAARLFDALHRADAGPHAAIAVAPIPETGLGLAINDRLRRAAHR